MGGYGRKTIDSVLSLSRVSFLIYFLTELSLSYFDFYIDFSICFSLFAEDA